MPNLPRIDPDIEHAGISVLRTISAGEIRGLNKIMVLKYHGEPVAVLFPYERYMAMQAELDRLMEICGGGNA